MRPRFIFLVLPLLAALATAPFAGCQAEGEGKPCDTNAGNAGNDDCQPPLVCTTGLTNANSPRCCPQDRANATTPECSLSSASLDGSNPAPPDSSTADTSSADTSTPETAASEAAADGPVESATEAGPEASAGDDASDGATSDGPAADAAGE
jgi:hypothetical protein